MRTVTVACCALNQWALDFEGITRGSLPEHPARQSARGALSRRARARNVRVRVRGSLSRARHGDALVGSDRQTVRGEGIDAWGGGGRQRAGNVARSTV